MSSEGRCSVPLTKAAKEKYIKTTSPACPHCGSMDIEGGQFEVDIVEGTGSSQSRNQQAWQPISCVTCKKTWFDVYELVDIEER